MHLFTIWPLGLCGPKVESYSLTLRRSKGGVLAVQRGDDVGASRCLGGIWWEAGVLTSLVGIGMFKARKAMQLGCQGARAASYIDR